MVPTAPRREARKLSDSLLNTTLALDDPVPTATRSSDSNPQAMRWEVALSESSGPDLALSPRKCTGGSLIHSDKCFLSVLFQKLIRIRESSFDHALRQSVLMLELL